MGEGEREDGIDTGGIKRKRFPVSPLYFLFPETDRNQSRIFSFRFEQETGTGDCIRGAQKCNPHDDLLLLSLFLFDSSISHAR